MNMLKTRLTNGERLLGTHVLLNDPVITEMVSNIGYDYIWIDTEHAAIDYHMLELHLIAARAGGTPAIVRVPWNDPVRVKRVLERSPDGIVFPMINTKEEADAAMRSCLYPPHGSRGLGPIRATRYGLDDLAAYVHRSAASFCRFIQIETATGIDNLREMIRNPAIDGVIIGPCDLAVNLGDLDQFIGEKTKNCIAQIIHICRDGGMPVGVSTGPNPSHIRFFLDQGVQFISAGSDFDAICAAGTTLLSTVKAMI